MSTRDGAGARFGAAALPGRWLDGIDEVAALRSLAEALHDGAFTAPDGVPWDVSTS